MLLQSCSSRPGHQLVPSLGWMRGDRNQDEEEPEQEPRLVARRSLAPWASWVGRFAGGRFQMPELVASTKTCIFASAFASVHQELWRFASGVHVALSKGQRVKHEHVSMFPAIFSF